MSYNWDDKTTLNLIQKYHENEILWNPKHRKYKNRCKRIDTLNVIANMFDTDRSEIERKLKNLTCHYFREKKKLEELRKTTTASDAEVEEPKWFAYKALNFLRDKNKPKEIVNEEQVPQEKPTTTSSSQKRKHHDGESDIAEAVQLLKDLSATTIQRDDAAIFGEYIATKIRRMDPPTSASVEHLIQNIIYQAEMGVYSQSAATMTVVPDYVTETKIKQPPPSTSPSRHSSDSDNSETQDSLYKCLGAGRP